MDAPPVQYVTTSDGYDIAYTISSVVGRPLLLLPPPMTHLGLHAQGRAKPGWFDGLASRSWLIQYDPRGQGLSSRGLREDSIAADWELDIEAIAEKAGLEHFAVFGATSNGYVAASYAVRHPEQVDALILWNTPMERKAQVPPSQHEMAKENWEFFLEVTGRMTFPWEDATFSKETVRETWNQEDYLIRARIWQELDFERVFSRVRIPTLVLATRTGLWGYATEAASKRIAALIPNAQLVIFADSGGGFIGYADDSAPGPAVVHDFLCSINSRREDVLNLSAHPAESDRSAFPGGLSNREIEVLRLLAGGKSNQQIADELVISLHTVRHHVSNILNKTGAANRTEAAWYAREHGLQ